MKRISRVFALAAIAALLGYGNARATVFTIPVQPPVGPYDTTQKANGGVLNWGGTQHTGSLAMKPIGTPAAPTVVTGLGTAGSTSVVYACTAVDINGNATIPSATTTFTTSNATRSATNTNLITCAGLPGAVGFIVHITNTSTVLGFCQTTSGASCTLADTGQTQTTYTPNTVDQTNIITGATINGNVAGAYTQQCGGTVATTGGSVIVKAPCSLAYTYCGCSVNLPNPPVAGDLCSCQITSTATTTASTNSSGTATSTATTASGFAVGVATAGLAATADINYWGGPQ